MEMAEGAVASAIKMLGDLLVQEATFLRGVRTDVVWLGSQLDWMKAFLGEADVRQRNGDERVKKWVREIREIAYDAEDVVDKFLLRIQSRGRPIKEFFRRHACILSDQVALHQIGNDISQIKLKIQNIREIKDLLGTPNLGEGRSELGVSLDQRLQAWRQTYHHLDDDKVVVGFEASEKFILGHLLDPQVKGRRVISIVGMGGTGKTTLAAKVYNSKEVKNHFSPCAWITVSQYCKVTDLLKNITTEVIGGETSKTDDGDFKVKLRLYDFLKHRTYFIVLDDIWEQDVWVQIKAAFPNKCKGSRILLTTRSTDVANSADPSRTPFKIPFLSPDSSWQLFLNVVFPSNQETISNCPKDLEELGNVLAKRCGGLPLALVVLGGLLSTRELTINSWREVAEDMDWKSRDRDKICQQILALSYNYLPHTLLKSCFLYLGCFPEDYCYKASELIRLWVAEGFIPQEEKRKLEETANDYIDELVKRCMVTVADRSVVTGRVKTFKIHDLLHELCISEAKEDGFIKICSNRDDITDHEIIASRRLVINQGIPVDRQDGFHHSEYKARSLLCFSPSPDINFLQYMSPGFNLLRVLHLSIWPSNLYEKIFKLINLRYLQLNKQDLVNLPSSIGKLRNLQTLDLRSTKVVNPPEALSKIQSLRHLYLGSGCTSCNTSLRLGRLRDLQTLKIIGAGPWIETELAKLSNIRKLKIDGVSVKHVRALSDSLHKQNHLTSLYLCTNSETSPSAASLFPSSSSHQYLVKLSLKGFLIYNCQLPQNLIKLSLEICELDEDVIAMVEKLPSLTIFQMKGTLPQQMIFSAGGFPRLQKLHIVPGSKQQQMGRVPPWRIESGAMPNLTYLEIDNSNNLTMLPHGLEHVSSLRQLKLGNADEGIVRRLSTEDRHKILHIPSVVTDAIPSVEQRFFEQESH